MNITRTSQLTGKTHTLGLPVTKEQMDLFDSPNRPLIQDIFPDLPREQREFIKTGITPEEWKEEFGEGPVTN